MVLTCFQFWQALLLTLSCMFITTLSFCVSLSQPPGIQQGLLKSIITKSRVRQRLIIFTFATLKLLLTLTCPYIFFLSLIKRAIYLLENLQLHPPYPWLCLSSTTNVMMSVSYISSHQSVRLIGKKRQNPWYPSKVCKRDPFSTSDTW